MNFIRTNAKKIVVVGTFALVIAGSGLASLASLSDTLVSETRFNTLSVDLTGNGQQSIAVTFDNIDPSQPSSKEQDLILKNEGSASATVNVTSSVTEGAGSDLAEAITVLVSDGTCASAGTRINGAGAWPTLANAGPSITPIALNAGASKTVCLHYSVAVNPATTPSVTAEMNWTATHP